MANIDQLVIVIAVESPNPDFMLVDKLIITCMSKNIRPLLVINKTDLDKSNGAEEIAVQLSLHRFSHHLSEQI